MEEVKVLDIFNIPIKKLVAIIDCKKEPSIGDYLIDDNDNIAWKIEGVVLHISKDDQSRPLVYMDTKNELRSVSLSSVDSKSNIERGDIYYLKRSNVRKL
ncbi:MAG: hypothetical protein AAGI25_21255 [Bacteroidota bacterium]